MARSMLPLALLLLYSIIEPARSQSEPAPTRLAPAFLSEPPSELRVTTRGGATLRDAALHCTARGDPPPSVTWVMEDGSPLVDRPGYWHAHSNGTLELPAGGSAPRGSLRCRAANAHGVLLSRDVTVRTVPEVTGPLSVTVWAAPEGGVAALSCVTGDGTDVTGDVTDVTDATEPAVLWYKDERLLSVDAAHPESRYLTAGALLLIRDMTSRDAGRYACRRGADRSRAAALDVPGWQQTAPRMAPAPRTVRAPRRAAVCIPCAAAGASALTWYREDEGRLQALPAAGDARWWQWGGGAALCTRGGGPGARLALLCKAYNQYGDATQHTTLELTDTLELSVTPPVIVADAGSTVRFSCNASVRGVLLRWLHDGQPVQGGVGGAAGAGGSELELRGVGRAARGVYQCEVRGPAGAQASAELRLGESPPELTYTFIEQALRAGGAVSLRCAAAARPATRIDWLLDGEPLPAALRPGVTAAVRARGEVTSTLALQAAREAGGRYTCRASNALGSVEHSARVNIYGPPMVRSRPPARAIAGRNFTLHCPYAGYPISSIVWRRAGAVVARGETLRLTPALSSHAGRYVCAVSAPGGLAASADVELHVAIPPQISPFLFSPELAEGSTVQLLCGVSAGDKPLYFTWLKDDAPLPPDLQVEEKSLNEFSLLMFPSLTERHSGRYTCRVSNHAATANYSATLSVKVAPNWVAEPRDAEVLLGTPFSIECTARGHPTPTVTWYRKMGQGTEGAEESADEWAAVRGAGGVLSSAAATSDVRGQYRCVADNGVGVPLTRSISITVHEPVHFEESGSGAQEVRVSRGAAAELACAVHGDPPLRLHWTHRGQRLDLDSYRWRVSQTALPGGLRSTLTLRAATRENAGAYRCHAANPHGIAEQLYTLHVREPPETPTGLQLGGTGSRWVRVRWRATDTAGRGGGENHVTGEGGGGVQYTAVCSRLHAATEEQITVNLSLDTTDTNRPEEDGHRIISARIESLRPASAYSIRLVATNDVGQSPQSDPLLFTTIEEVPSGSPENIRVKPSNEGELHIAWTAPPVDSWNGELLGYAVSWRELARAEGEVGEQGGWGDAAGSAGNAGGTGRSLTAPGARGSQLTLSGLRQFARYAITLRAFNRAGPGPSAPTLYATVADGVPDTAPVDVSCEGVAPHDLRVRWTPPVSHVPLRGFDVSYAPVMASQSWSGPLAWRWERAEVGSNNMVLTGLTADTPYSVQVRARGAAGPGPRARAVSCRTSGDVGGAVLAVRVLAAGGSTLRVSWPTTRARHYSLHARELGKMSGELSQRVESSAGEDTGDTEEEVWAELRGLRLGARYEVWVRAVTETGAGPPSRTVLAAPMMPAPARISSFGLVLRVSPGARIRLPCSAVGTPPLRRRWSPLPHSALITDAGGLLINNMEAQWAGNYTCSVQNEAGADAVTHAVRVYPTLPAPPAAPRLLRAALHELQLAWDAPLHVDADDLLGYTVWWNLETETAAAQSTRVPAGVTGSAGGAAVLRGLACGARYRVWLVAHWRVAVSPHSPTLFARTKGEKPRAAPAMHAVWANSSALRINLLAWRLHCAVRAWSVAIRPAGGGGSGPGPAWAPLPPATDVAEAGGLQPGAWYEVRVTAHAAAGDASAAYRAATLTLDGENVGETMELPAWTDASLAGGTAGSAEEAGARAAALVALLAAAALAMGAALLLLRRRGRRASPPAPPHAQLYSTEPGRHAGKTMTPPGDSLVIREISPYATFSMAGGLQLRTFGDADPGLCSELQAPSHAGRECERDSESESSGSPCAACRLHRPRRDDTLPLESSTEDTTYGSRVPSRATPAPPAAARPPAQRTRARRRRDHARTGPGPGPGHGAVSHRF